MSQTMSVPASGNRPTSSDRAAEPLLVRLWQMANADFCPQHNAWAYKLKHPLAVFSAATALTIFCGFVINPLAYVLGGMMLFVLVVGLAWPAVAVRAAVVRVDWGRRRVTEGQAVAVTLELRNRLPLPLAGLVVTGLEGVADAKLPLLRPWERRTVVWRATTYRRGVFPSSPSYATASDVTGTVRVQSQMPFGVWRAERAIAVDGRLVVHPRSRSLEGLVDLGEPREGEERATDRRAGTSGDLLGVRRFREGDSLRHVHWAQTARQRELIVCERQATIASAVRIGVELPADDVRCEDVLRAAASVARRLVDGGMAVEFVLPQTTLRSEGQLTSLLDGLAAVERPAQTTPAATDVSLRLGFDGACRLRLQESIEWSHNVATAWRTLCRAA